MLFSAIGVMVIYLKTPAPQAAPSDLPADNEPKAITLPDTATSWAVNTGSNNPEVPLWDAPDSWSGNDTWTGTAIPTPWGTVEPTPTN